MAVDKYKLALVFLCVVVLRQFYFFTMFQGEPDNKSKSIPGLIIASMNNPDLLERLLLSVDYPIDVVVIISQGDRQLSRFAKDLALSIPAPGKIGRIAVVAMPYNVGVASAWNTGLRIAFGEWGGADWAIVSGDDNYMPYPGGWAEIARAHQRDPLEFAMLPCNSLHSNHDCYGYHMFAISRNLIISLNTWFDEAVFPAYFEDCDHEHQVRAHYKRVKFRGLNDKKGSPLGYQSGDGNCTVSCTRKRASREFETKVVYNWKHRNVPYASEKWNCIPSPGACRPLKVKEKGEDAGTPLFKTPFNGQDFDREAWRLESEREFFGDSRLGFNYINEASIFPPDASRSLHRSNFSCGTNWKFRTCELYYPPGGGYIPKNKRIQLRRLDSV